MLVEPDHAALGRPAELVADGRLRVRVGRTLPLADMAELHRLGEAGGTGGKLVATL